MPNFRIGAVNYLNSKPLIYGFAEHVSDASLSCDLPSRLADRLAANDLDIALIPSFEALRGGSAYTIISDACVAAYGPVRSVKLYFRVPPASVKTLALDEGSRTSSALSQILLWRRNKIRPVLKPLPIGDTASDSDADAVLLIGDRAMRDPEERFVETWDLSEEWYRDTHLPFVFACWTARLETSEQISASLSKCRDEGCLHLKEIAAREAPLLDISPEEAEEYLSKNLHFHFNTKERESLKQFEKACEEVGLLNPASNSGPAD